jgi:hypothetical protein
LPGVNLAAPSPAQGTGNLAAPSMDDNVVIPFDMEDWKKEATNPADFKLLWHRWACQMGSTTDEYIKVPFFRFLAFALVHQEALFDQILKSTPEGREVLRYACEDRNWIAFKTGECLKECIKNSYLSRFQKGQEVMFRKVVDNNLELIPVTIVDDEDGNIGGYSIAFSDGVIGDTTMDLLQPVNNT